MTLRALTRGRDAVAGVLRAVVWRRTYNKLTHGLYRRGVELLVPPGQSVYDPAVFGRWDRATQLVVRRDDQDDGIWTLGFDEMLYEAQLEAGRRPDAIQRDRYPLALGLLAPGSGVCLDACTASPDPSVRAHVEQLGYRYVAVDIEGDGVRVKREDVTALTLADDSVARILSLDTLEHVDEYPAALAEFHRVLEPGGVLILHVPAYFFDRPESAPLDPRNDPWGHVRYFSARELVAALLTAGLVVLRVGLHLDYGAALCVAAKPAPSPESAAGAA